MKNYMVIGGSSGIGKALAEKLAGAGHRVFATYHDQQVESSERLSYSRFNVLDSDPDLSFLPEALNGIAYCPGSIQLAPFHRLSADAFLEDYNLQVAGAVRVLQAVRKKLTAAPAASVVLFSTVAVQSGFNFHSMVSASKGAIEGLVRALAAEWAPAVRVNAVAPSLTDTPMAEKLINSEAKRDANAKRHPLRRIGRPEDIAALAAFLLSDDSSWITGQIMHVDGGMSAVGA